MAWYWIVLIIFAYTLLGSVTCGVIKRKDRTFDDFDAFIVFFVWPLFMLVAFYKRIINTIADPKPRQEKPQNKKTNLSDI